MKLYRLLVLLLYVYFSEAQATREREPLEAFDLNKLKVVKVYLEGSCAPSAGVRDPNGYLNRVFVGDYIGKHAGLVLRITIEGILVREVFEVRDGEWKEKEILLKLIPE